MTIAFALLVDANIKRGSLVTEGVFVLNENAPNKGRTFKEEKR